MQGQRVVQLLLFTIKLHCNLKKEKIFSIQINALNNVLCMSNARIYNNMTRACQNTECGQRAEKETVT